MKKIAVLTVGLLLAGCASVKSDMLNERTALIRVSDQGWGMDLSGPLIKRAAEMANRQGYPAFMIGDSQDSQRYSSMVMPGYSNTTAQASCYGYSCAGSAQTTSSPAQVLNFTENRSRVMVHFFREGEVPDGTPGLFKTAYVLRSK